ncbi:MAG: DNA uptake protein ComE-like DNA-binding protein [Chitinophagales bacterium]|jgi:DNA uptake protein ComE-like DNA-binding protein
MITILLLIAVAWLLWNIQQHLEEANDRQRNVADNLSKLLTKLDQTGPTTSTSNITKTNKAEPSNSPPVKVGLNSASKGVLRKLPKVGAVVAERIIEARPFERIEQLKQVDGITENLYLSLKDLVFLD